MERGKFITVEGIEGVGKSTNVDVIVSTIEASGFSVIRTREPGGTALAERIRDMLLDCDSEPVPDVAELLLFFAARSLHISNTISPALAAGKWVVCDRFTDASRAYQGYGRGLSLERIDTLAEWVQQALRPDLTILLDAPAKIGMQRVGQRGATDRLESEQQSFYERVRQGYLELAKQYADRYTVIDAAQDIAEVGVNVAAATQRLLDNNSSRKN